jgi:hypothetical protein
VEAEGEIIGQGIKEVISLIPPLHEFEVVQLRLADFNLIDALAKQLNDFWVSQDISAAYLCASNINTILIRLRPYIFNALRDQVPPKVTTLQAGFELIAGKTKFVGGELHKFLFIRRKLIHAQQLTPKEREDLDALNDVIPYQWAQLNAALQVYKRASDKWTPAAQGIVGRILSNHLQMADMWESRGSWTEENCNQVQNTFYNFQMAVSDLVTMPHEWRIEPAKPGT